ncbi:deoxyribonuclease V [Chitinophaga sp. Cy-1792]|uniref:deoxyribonuclease V n=1 Tax=Chitinophaga sp. Cy-1792 TaxID=2608339 RepID=UPI0014209D3F|nr:deoxyribonuclease V [Chitinophaga sp. Cy-1792]NIG53376.1 deoxyribonuclease V [Chitinophaga sp. Cy-1792]
MISEAAAIAEQTRLSKTIISVDHLPHPVKFIAGTDVEYDKETDLIAGSIVVLNYETLEIVEISTHCMQVTFPYIPGLFSFRELPPLLVAYEQLQQKPDLIVCDGQGMAHPRRFGMASHLGVTIQQPTIGCGKTRLCGYFEEPAPERGAVSPLLAEDNQEVIGNVLRTQTGINPVYVSVGHMISLATATDIVLKLATSYRLPETTRIADNYGRLALEEYKKSRSL